MKADFSLDVQQPDTVGRVVSPSLRSSGKVGFQVDTGEDLEITVEADRLGSLRGGANTALMLTGLAVKFLEQG